MIKNYIIPALAILGLSLGIFMVYRGTIMPPIKPFTYHPPRNPYQHAIVAEGIIESVGRNYSIGVPFSQLIEGVYVKVGDRVKRGQPLFMLDTRQLLADKVVAQAQLAIVYSDYCLQSQQFTYYKQLQCKDAVSKKEYTNAYYAKMNAMASVRHAIAVVNQVTMQIERSIIRSPLDGFVLQCEARVGEVANQNAFSAEAFLVCGTINPVQLRIDIAEEDAWRYKAGSRAIAYPRGNADIAIPLQFDYIEPLVIPKKTLTGSDAETVDTRVLQVLYRFSKEKYPVYVGQLLDVYIEADEQPHIGNQEYHD